MSELPTGWEIATFEDVFDRLQYGLTAKASADAPGTRFLRITDIDDGNVDWDAVPGFDGAEDVERYILGDGDFVFARSGSVEKAARLQSPPKSVFASYLIRGRPIEPALGDWLSYFIWSRDYLAQIADRAAGIGMSNVSAEKLKTVSVSLAPLAEQRRIVAKLDVLTARTARARADLDRIPALATRYKQAVLAKAFSGELTVEWRSCRGLPEPRMTRLADLVAEPVRNGLSVRGSDEPPGVRSLRLSALRGDAVNLDDVRFLPITEDRARRFLLRDGDILVSRGNGTKTLVGISALVGHVHEPTIFPDTAFRVRVAQDRVDPQWLSHIWSAPQARSQIEAVAKTTAGIWKVSQADLAGVALPFFELPEQIEMVRRLGHALAEIDRMTAEAAAARRLVDRLDQAVLARAFRGELVAQDPVDEPAGVLLDRIRVERTAAPKAARGRRKAITA